MLPPINIKLDRSFEPSVFGWFAPIIPGFIVGIGVAVTRPDIFESALQLPSLADDFRPVAAALAAWICGGFVRLVGLALAGLPAAGLTVFLNQRQGKGELRPSQRTPWRRLARKLLGSDLVPKYDFPLTDNVRAWLDDAISKLPKTAESERIRNEIVRGVTAVEQADAEWDDWHSILSKYVDWESSPRGRWLLNSVEATGYVHASGLALLLVVCHGTDQVRDYIPIVVALYALCWAIEFLVLFGYAETAKDRFGYRLTAEIIQNLAELSRRNSGKQESNTQTPGVEPPSKET